MTAAVHVRRATSGDERALSLVGQATFLETFAGVLEGEAILQHCQHAHAAATYAGWLADPHCALWLAEVAPGDTPVGYMVVAPPDLPSADPARDLELKRIYLLGRFQGGGLGGAMLAQAVEHARSTGMARLLLGVYAGNASAIGFYRRQGFVQVAERRFTVGDRDYDDHVLALDLYPEPPARTGAHREGGLQR